MCLKCGLSALIEGVLQPFLYILIQFRNECIYIISVCHTQMAALVCVWRGLLETRLVGTVIFSNCELFKLSHI